MKHLRKLSTLFLLWVLGHAFPLIAQQASTEEVNKPVDQPEKPVDQKEMPAIPPEKPRDVADEPVLGKDREPALTPAEQVNLSPEIKLMQEIEPGFMPKDERAVELFMLQRSVAATESLINTKIEQKEKSRAVLSQKIREDLGALAATKSTGLNTRLDSLVDEAIKHLEVALTDFPNDSRYSAHALYNLGRYYFEKDEKDYFEKLARYSEAKEKGLEDVPYPEENFSRTINTYELLIDKHPDFKEMVDVYYLLGLAMWYEGAFHNAVGRFEKLIAKFPDSRLVEEVWFRLGEFFYDMDDYEEAIRAYTHVSADPRSPFFDKAIYKIAWSHFQRDRFMRSVEYFVKVIELTAAETDTAASTGMRAEAIRYVVKNFSEELAAKGVSVPRAAVGQNAKAIEREYAEKLGVELVKQIGRYFAIAGNPPYLREILLETASQLLDESKTEGAILAFEKLIELDPNHQDNPRIASQIVEILEEANRVKEARDQSFALLKHYGKTSPWYLAQKNNLAAQRYAREAVRDAMLSLAVQFHKSGKDKKAEGDTAGADRDFKEAASLYSDYLKEFPERDDTHKAIFYFAESSYEMNDYRAALDAYTLLKEYPLPMPDNFRRDATFNIVFTFRHVLESEAKEHRFKDINFDNLTSKQRGLEPEEIPELGQRYLASIDEFLKLAPTDEQVPVLLFHAAAIYYVYGHADDALKRFFYIIDTYPKTQAATVAARLILDDAVAKEDWARVVELARLFKAQQLDGKTGDFSRLEGNARFKMARAVFEDAAKLQQENQLNAARAKYKESALLFAALLKEDPTNPYADIMLFNSARAIAESGTTTEALPLYRQLYTQYPNSQYAKVARFQEALALEKMLKFAEAAKAYDAIIKLDPKSASAADAMLNKALLYEAAGDFSNAAAAYLDFAKSHPERDEASDALLTAASLNKKMGRTAQQIAMLEQFIKRYRGDKQKIPSVIEAHVQIADTYGDLEKSAKTSGTAKHYGKLSLDNYRAAVALYHPDMGSAFAAFFAAKARLILEKPEQDAFRKLTINARLGKGQADQMTAMLKKLTELAAKNEVIIKEYAQPVSNAEAMRRIGALYEHLARTMVKAPCPKDVSSVDEFACDEYLVLLEDKAAVIEQKAVSAYKQAYEIALSAYDAPPDLADNILAGLNRMRPGEYQRVGNLIEKPAIGAIYGQGRMLSTGKMASGLHQQEVDPDKTQEAPAAEPNTELENKSPEMEPAEPALEKTPEQVKEVE